MTRIVPDRNPVIKEMSEETGKSKTEQSHKKQCDINYILKDYAKTGIIKHAHQNAGKYDDVSQVSFQQAQDVVADVKSMFESLPAATRQQFNNQPGEFINFVQQPENGPQLIEMGLAEGIDGKTAEGSLITEMQALVTTLKEDRVKGHELPPVPGLEQTPDK